MENSLNLNQLASDIKQWGRELGFQQVGITDTDLQAAENHLNEWLARGFYGEMQYMEKHGTKRSRPNELMPGTLRIISVRMDYLPPDNRMTQVLADKEKAYVSRYALGHDYHQVIRKRLKALAKKINEHITPFSYRVFVDSAPVLEKPIAQKAGIGWIGKHTIVLNRQAGSWFFLGEIYTDLPLPIDTPATEHCGTCQACMDICPTQAIVGPAQLDARRCISYLTIEYRGSIPVEFRPLIGNRIFGCDDCQLVCPWNRFAKLSQESAFQPRHSLIAPQLVELFLWDEETFNKETQGSAIRRATYVGWLRNIAVALGNAPTSAAIIEALQNRLHHESALVREHVEWALQQHQS